MDALRPGHAHRSSSDRLLNNYLDSQKHLTQSLLTLLSHSHSSTSSLLAYVTSSPGVVLPIRQSVRHAAFEGPLSASLLESVAGSQNGSAINGGDTGTPGWAAYVSSLEQFRKDLKQIHLLEEELSRVKRDREILVTRLIKTTKSRPTKSDLSAIASTYTASGRPDGSVASSRASQYSVTSDGSASGKEGKRASKLAEAQAELLGCEEHLRGLEVRIESERNRVMTRGLAERFRAMEVVAKMWQAQSRRGLEDLEKHYPVHDSFEVDSNGSIAPSQSASQIGFDDGHHASPVRNGVPKHISSRQAPGSITGSIAEEDEDGSSGDDVPGGQLVLHENRPGSRTPLANGHPKSPSGHTHKPSPLGVPSVNARSRPVSSTFGGSQYIGNDSDSDDGPANRRSGGRRAASDVGAMAYHPPTGRTPLRRTFSHEGGSAPGPRRPTSPSSSIGSKKKKRGFFASLSKFFKGNKSKREGSFRSGRDSPPYGTTSSGKVGGPWHTRTEANLKRGASRAGGRSRAANDSSSDDEAQGPLVSVSNNRNSTFSIENVGRPQSAASKRLSSSTPVAPGLIPKPRPVSRAGSVSTVTPKNTGPRVSSPTPSLPAAGVVSRSNTVKSTASTGTTKRIRKNGSISRAAVGSQQAAEGRTIMSLVDAPPPAMPDVPKAPKSQVTPSMELPKAPGSSLVLPSQLASRPSINGGRTSPTPSQSISRSNSYRAEKVQPDRPNTPSLPPSKTLQPPLKSAMRSTSPVPPSASPLSPPLELPTTLFTVAAPGPVKLPVEPPKPAPVAALTSAPAPAPAKVVTPAMSKRNSYASATGDEASVYESAVEGGTNGEEDEDTSDEDEVVGYKVVENDIVARAGLNVGPPAIVKVPVERRTPIELELEEGGLNDDAASTTSGDTATGRQVNNDISPSAPKASDAASVVSRRKSVRMAVPDSPGISTQSHATSQGPPTTSNLSAKPAAVVAPASPPITRPTDAQWSTRIGKMRDDSSDEEIPGDEEYTKARRSLSRNSGKFVAVNTGKTNGEKKKKSSTKRSTKGSLKG